MIFKLIIAILLSNSVLFADPNLRQNKPIEDVGVISNIGSIALYKLDATNKKQLLERNISCNLIIANVPKISPIESYNVVGGGIAENVKLELTKYNCIIYYVLPVFNEKERVFEFCRLITVSDTSKISEITVAGKTHENITLDELHKLIVKHKGANKEQKAKGAVRNGAKLRP